jgi:16S rRNA (cytosine1402-N4)-methyltransferase
MFEHRTVLLEEAVTGLNIKADGIYVDCTLGGGGHSELILSKLGAEGRLVAIDQDIKAIENAKERLAWSGKQINFVQRNFKYIKEIIESLEIAKVDGIVYDLGISSPQVDEGERGFSYWSEATLDMRMDKSAQLTAHEIVNCWDESELIRIIYEYGEERFAKRIAQSIIRERQIKSIETTTVLADIVKNSIPAATRRTGGHPARRTFQAIRIAVNDELNVFKESLIAAINLLNAGGRISVITFHSLEDRICKEVFNEYAGGCICPPDLPICGCGIKPTIKIITKKPVVPSALEIAENPRARSAKLRIIERLVP